jgi:hypothetical protein
MTRLDWAVSNYNMHNLLTTVNCFKTRSEAYKLWDNRSGRKMHRTNGTFLMDTFTDLGQSC